MCKNTYKRPVFNKSIELKDNAMLKVRPELFDEWNFEKNVELGLNVYKATKGSVKKAYWICNNCKSTFDARIDSRVHGNNCPYCSGQKVNHTNSLASLRPNLARQWHPTKNGDLTPDNFTCGSGQKVWWLCELGHEWETAISDRSKEKGTSCPYCNKNNPKVLKGFNDLWTVNKKLASMLLNPEDGYIHTDGSNNKVNWKCPDCGKTIKNKAISKVKERGLSCNYCSDGIKYPEKVMLCLLEELGINFYHDKNMEWSNNKRYDLFIPQLNIIIEMHGKQHYDSPFGGVRGKSVKQEQENDEYKYELALKNGVSYYFSIDCRVSDFEYIKNSILCNELVNHLDFTNINWDAVFEKSLKSKVFEVCDIYNKINIEQKELSKISGLSDATVRRYLKIGAKLGITNYTPNSERNKRNSVKWMQKEIIQLDLKNNFIASFSSISLAGKSLGKKNYSSISACCKGKAKTAFGYRWMYKKAYEENKQIIN